MLASKAKANPVSFFKVVPEIRRLLGPAPQSELQKSHFTDSVFGFSEREGLGRASGFKGNIQVSGDISER